MSELKLPAWLNEEFFSDIIKKEMENELLEYKFKIKSFELASDKGANYTSTMYRVSIEVDLVTKRRCSNKFTFDYIVKAMLMNLPQLKEFSVFPKEIDMYQIVIPQLEKLLSNKVKFGPKCLKTSTTEDYEYLVLEDLKSINYKMGNRYDGLDFNHINLTLGKLSKFHAASAVHHDKFGDFPDRVQKTIYNEAMKKQFSTFIDPSLKLIIEMLEEWPFGQKYAHKLKKWDAESMFEKIVNGLSPHQNNDFKVVNHADLWLNNQLFSYNADKKPNDMLFVDFQISFWGTPAIDLWYFFLSSTQNDIKHEYDRYLKTYHDYLVDALKSLNYAKKIPTLVDIHIMMLTYGVYGSACLIGIVPICLADSSDESTVENLTTNTDEAIKFKRNMFNNPRYKQALKNILPLLDQKGLLDI